LRCSRAHDHQSKATRREGTPRPAYATTERGSYSLISFPLVGDIPATGWLLRGPGVSGYILHLDVAFGSHHTSLTRAHCRPHGLDPPPPVLVWAFRCPVALPTRRPTTEWPPRIILNLCAPLCDIVQCVLLSSQFSPGGLSLVLRPDIHSIVPYHRFSAPGRLQLMLHLPLPGCVWFSVRPTECH